MSGNVQLQCGLIEHMCTAGLLCARPEPTFTGKAINNLGHSQGMRTQRPLPSLPGGSDSAEAFARSTPKLTDLLKHSFPQKPTPPGSPKAEQKESMSCRQHRKNPGFLFELGQVLEAVSNAGAACGGGFSQCLGTRGPSGVRVYRRNAVSTQAGHRPR